MEVQHLEPAVISGNRSEMNVIKSDQCDKSSVKGDDQRLTFFATSSFKG